MALEQFHGAADAKSDQFGLCASFFVALYGRPAYESKSVAGLLDALEGGRVDTPASAHVPEFVRRVLLRGLQRRPDARFKDVRAVAHALRSGARRRRWMIGGSMASVGAAAIASVVWASQPEPCTDEREQIEAIIDGEPERIAALIEASGRPYPGELADRFSADLGKVVEGWADQRLEACRASRDRDPEVARPGEQRLRCLDDAAQATERTLRGIESLTRAQADALPTVTRFIQGAHDCSDADRDVFGNERGRNLLALFRSGLAAEGRLESKKARAAYEAVLEGSEPGEFAHLRAETHTRLSEVCERIGDMEGVERHLIGSLDEAQNAGDAGLTALHWLAVADTLPLSESGEAYELIVSRSYHARERGTVSDWTRAQLLYAEAHDRVVRGQQEQALALVTEAITVGEEVGAPALAFMYALESTLRLARGELELAEDRIRAAVRVQSARVGANHPEVAMFVGKLASVQSWQGRDVDAVETYGRSIAILEEWPGYLSPVLVQGYSGRGSALRNTEDLDGALLDYERASAVAKGLGEQGEPLLQGLNDDRARTYRLMNRPDEALRLIDLVLRGPQGGDAASRGNFAYAMILRAGILSDLDRREDALAQLDQAMPVIADAFAAEGAGRIQAAVEIAEIY